MRPQTVLEWENFFSRLEFEHLTVQPLDIRYIDWAGSVYFLYKANRG